MGDMQMLREKAILAAMRAGGVREDHVRILHESEAGVVVSLETSYRTKYLNLYGFRGFARDWESVGSWCQGDVDERVAYLAELAHEELPI